MHACRHGFLVLDLSLPRERSSSDSSSCIGTLARISLLIPEVLSFACTLEFIGLFTVCITAASRHEDELTSQIRSRTTSRRLLSSSLYSTLVQHTDSMRLYQLPLVVLSAILTPAASQTWTTCNPLYGTSSFPSHPNDTKLTSPSPRCLS